MAIPPETTDPDAGVARDRVELILSQVEALPTLPAVAIRLLELTTSSQSSARDIVDVVETDQALTAKLLSLVRRADLGVRGDVMTLERVVVLLGFEAVRSAVLSVQIYETFASVEPHDETDFDRAEFWKHSLAVACAAQLIAEARRNGQSRAAEAFVCGLLHDIGKLALDACLPKSYARIVREVKQRHRCISDVERDVLGLDHTIAGKRLLGRWKLPRAFLECAWLHHQPPAALPSSIEAAELVRVVHLADHLARRQRIGFSGYGEAGSVDEVARLLGLRDEALADVVSRLPQTMEQHCQLVGLERLTSTDLYAQALADANEELGRLNQSLGDANRRLALRSKYFDAIAAFDARLSLDDRLTDICRAAACCTAELFGVNRAIAIVAHETESVGLLVAVTGQGEECVSVDAAELEERLRERRFEGGAGMMCVADLSRAAAERVEAILGGERAWVVPFVHANTVLGGVVVAPAGGLAEGRGQPRAEVSALSHAFGLAAATALVRRAEHRLQEELAEVNRQLHGAQDELLRARSLAMIAQMAAGAAHELNNPLAVISGRVQMLARAATADPDRRALEIVHEQCERATQIVSELMAFAKPDAPRTEVVPVSSWAASLRRTWLERSSLEPHEIRVSISDPGLQMRVDTRQLAEIFDALLANAIEAVAGVNARLEINSTSSTSDDTVVLAVRDNGRGMSPEVREHSLDPFFSYRTAGRGRGLGLSRAARLAQINGGRLWLDSTEGEGTTVYVELPAVRRP